MDDESLVQGRSQLEYAPAFATIGSSKTCPMHSMIHEDSVAHTGYLRGVPLTWNHRDTRQGKRIWLLAPKQYFGNG